MAITRTPMIDDDGSGTTGTIINNAWKQELYNQIDAFVGTYGSFTPVDASAAALVFSTATGTYAKVGRLVFFALQVVYPATANGSQALIGGLPYPNTGGGGAAAQGYGQLRVWYLPVGTTQISPLHTTTGVAITNADMTGANIIVSGTYLTT
jgi:hypothetical protein